MLTYLDATADAETVSSVLRSDGVVAVTGLVDPEIADTVAAELRPDLDSKGLKTVDAFNGDKTNRYGDVLRTAPSAATKFIISPPPHVSSSTRTRPAPSRGRRLRMRCSYR